MRRSYSGFPATGSACSPTAMEKTVSELQTDPAYAESGLVTGCDAQGNQLAPRSS